jgi:hypothetical protein
MSIEQEKVMYLRKSADLHEISNNRLIQILIAIVGIYSIVNSYQHRTEFDACYELAVLNTLDESSTSLKSARAKGVEAVKQFELTKRLQALDGCAQKK